MYGLQCPKRLFLHQFRKDLLPKTDEQQQTVFTAGIQAGQLAQKLFPHGVDASPASPYAYQDSVARTQEYLQTQEVIYEACFQYEGALCAIDLLVKKNKAWYAYEVKGSNSVKAQHITDAAFQYYVITNAGIPLEDISIIHYNRNYVRQGDLDVRELFTLSAVTDEVKEQQSFISTHIHVLKDLLKARQEPHVAIGPQCDDPYECPFKGYCRKNEGLEDEAPRSTLPLIRKKPLQTFLNDLRYPLYFFDFETVQYGIPPYNQSSPFQQLPFQYSIHKKNGLLDDSIHMEYLGNGVDDPREGLIEQMLNDLGSKGSILAWHSSFELSRWKELARDFPKYKQHIEALLPRMVDLKLPFQHGWIEIPACRGSASIKVVLPVFIPELSYDDLDIQDGRYASLVYAQFAEQHESMQDVQRQQLLDYCHLDTYAMVRILEKMYRLL